MNLIKQEIRSLENAQLILGYFLNLTLFVRMNVGMRVLKMILFTQFENNAAFSMICFLIPLFGLLVDVDSKPIEVVILLLAKCYKIPKTTIPKTVIGLVSMFALSICLFLNIFLFAEWTTIVIFCLRFIMMHLIFSDLNLLTTLFIPHFAMIRICYDIRIQDSTQFRKRCYLFLLFALQSICSFMSGWEFVMSFVCVFTLYEIGYLKRI